MSYTTAVGNGGTPWYQRDISPLEQDMLTRLDNYGYFDANNGGNYGAYSNAGYGESSAFDKGLNAAGLTAGGVFLANHLKHVPPSLPGFGPEKGNMAYRAAQWAQNSGRTKLATGLNTASKASGGFLSGLTKFGNWFKGVATKAFSAVARTGVGKFIGKIASSTGIRAIGAKVLGWGARLLPMLGITGPIGWAIGGIALAASLAFMIL